MKTQYSLGFLIVLISFILQSCNSEKKQPDFQKEWALLMSLPDDSLTSEQKLEKLKITQFVFENLLIEDSLILELSKEDFVREGLRGEYWDFCARDIRNFNHFIRGNKELQMEFLNNFIVQKNKVLCIVDSLISD